VLLLLLLIFLVPIVVYCLVLAIINRRPHPVLVSGLWDCVGLLFAVSGFFLAVVPGLFTQLYAKSVRRLPLEQDPRESLSALFNLWWDWWWIWLLYYLVLVWGGAVLLWLRRSRTVIYNIDPDRWEGALAHVVAQLGLEHTRYGREIIIERPALAEEETLVMEGIVPDTAVEQKPASSPVLVGHPARLRVEMFPTLCNLTLHWDDPSPLLRETLETELARTLRHVPAGDNPSAAWFLGIGACLALTAFFIVVVLLLWAYLPPRRW
jgi:hypothetical protein